MSINHDETILLSELIVKHGKTLVKDLYVNSKMTAADIKNAFEEKQNRIDTIEYADSLNQK